MWRSHHLLQDFGQLSEASVAEAIHFDEVKMLLKQNCSAIEDFVEARKLESIEPTKSGAPNIQVEASRYCIDSTLGEMQKQLRLYENLIAKSIPQAGGELRREIESIESELAGHVAAVEQMVALADTDIDAAIELAEMSILPNLRQNIMPQIKDHSDRVHQELQMWGQNVAESARSANTRLAVTGIGALVLAIAAGSALGFLLTGPIRRLKQAALALAEGDFHQRIENCGKDEMGALGSAFNLMADKLQNSNEALGRTNKTMEKQVQKRAVQLEQVHENLRKSQFELVQHEKMSLLGQLSAGMAHEVNTPTAAILNASVDSGEHLQDLMEAVMKLDRLPVETRQWLTHMFEVLFRNDKIHSEISVRQERREVEKLLVEKGYGDCRRMAEVMVAYGIREMLDDGEMLARLSNDVVLSVLEHILALRVSSQISETSARKIARIVRSMRVYAHSSQGQVLDMDINESIDNTLVIMNSRVKRVANVKTNFGENLPAVRCGAELLQVWTNILSNACDAIQESGNEGMGLIEISTRLEGGNVVVEISDDGGPIPEDVMDKMFDPFFTTKRIGKGMGLGLSICSNIVKQWDGILRAKNDDGRAIFEILLPTKANSQGWEQYPEEIAVGESFGL